MNCPSTTLRHTLYFAILLSAVSAWASTSTYVVAHRGDAKAAPENTLAALRAARGIADFIEFDVCTTKDGHLVVIHDDTLERTTNGRGLVSSLTLAEIRGLDAGSKFSKSFARERIPTIDESIAEIGESAIPIIDHKTGTAVQIVEAIRRNKILDRCIVTGFDFTTMREVKRLEPRITVTVNLGKAPTDVQIAQFTAAGINAVLIYKTAISAEMVSRLHALGFWVFTWAAETADEVRALQAMGVDAVYADSLRIARGVLPKQAEGFFARRRLISTQ